MEFFWSLNFSRCHVSRRRDRPQFLRGADGKPRAHHGALGGSETPTAEITVLVSQRLASAPRSGSTKKTSIPLSH